MQKADHQIWLRVVDIDWPGVGVCGEEEFVFFIRAEVQNRLHQDQDYPCEVVGSWNTWYGEQDQAGKQQEQWRSKRKK